MPDPAVHDSDFAPVERIDGALDSGVLFLCDHASNRLPPDYGDLGLPAAQFERHIAYDIGAAAATRHLARAFGAPAVLTTFSRLLIDPNRGADDPTLVMRLSDGAIVPANARVDAAEIEHRRRRFWQPYRDAVTPLIDAMSARMSRDGERRGPAIVAVHSFTPFWKDASRPWTIGVLWDRDDRLARPLIEALGGPGEKVGDNQPYDGALEGDTMHAHGTQRGLPHALIEFRQDLIGTDAGAARWATRLGDALRPILAQPDLHRIAFFGSRTDTGRRRETGS